MATYLYCLLATRRDPPPGLTGLGGVPVRSLDAAGLRAWVATIPTRPAADPDAARAHDHIVRAALASGETPLPARFGQLFASDAACIAELQARAAGFRSALERVAGTVEMVVHFGLLERAVGETGSAAGPSHAEGAAGGGGASGPGRRYLEQVRHRLVADSEQRSVIDLVRDRMRALMGTALRDERVDVVREGGTGVALSHLLERGAVDAWRQAVNEVRGLPGLARVTTTGPYAPYSFVGIDDGSD